MTNTMDAEEIFHISIPIDPSCTVGRVAKLHDDEKILSKGDANMIPTEFEFERAKEVVNKYEKRREELNKVKKSLGNELSKFEQLKFKVNKRDKQVIFSGVLDGELKMGTSKVFGDDEFNEDIGKLIAVLKSTNQDIGDIVKLVERRRGNSSLRGAILRVCNYEGDKL